MDNPETSENVNHVDNPVTIADALIAQMGMDKGSVNFLCQRAFGNSAIVQLRRLADIDMKASAVHSERGPLLALVQADLAERYQSAVETIAARDQEISRLCARGSGEKARADKLAKQVDDLKTILRPAEIGRIQAMAPEERDERDRLTLALWDRSNRKRMARFMAELATLTDTECDFLNGAHLRSLARLLVLDSGEPLVPRLYGEEDRSRAVSLLERKIVAGEPTFANRSIGSIVDTVAEALGLRRAG